MKQWCRMWNEAPTDLKWLSIGRRAGVRPGDVWSLYSMLMACANQAAEEGAIARFSIEDAATFLDLEEGQVGAVLDEFKRRGMVVGERLAAWERRNPQREDPGSTERSRACRGRQGTAATPVQRGATQCNAPDSEKIPPLTPPLRVIAKQEGEGDPPRAVARAGAFGAPKVFSAKEKRDAWLGNAIREAARVTPDKVEELTVALLEDDPPRWANEAAERLNRLRRQRLAAERRGAGRTRERRSAVRQPELLLPIAGKRAA